MQAQERVFGWIQAETELDEYKARNDAFDAALEEEYGGEIVDQPHVHLRPGQRGDDRDDSDRAHEGSRRHDRS